MRTAPPCFLAGTALVLALAVLGFAALVVETPPDALQLHAQPAAAAALDRPVPPVSPSSFLETA